jgi:citrate lyase beta subunit
VPAVIFDLEASVPTARKQRAREAVQQHLQASRRPGGPELWVRVNGVAPEFDRDVAHIDWSKADGAMLAQAEDPERLTRLAEAGAKRLLPLIESATGFAALSRLAAVPGVARFAIGTWDLVVDLGLLSISDPDESELIWQLRGALVVASRQAGLLPPIDGVYARLDDEAGFERACRRAERLGFGGKLLVHPGQLQVANAVFGPDPGRLRIAREIITAYERAERHGVGVVRVRGEMVDRSMAERARALLARWPDTGA